MQDLMNIFASTLFIKFFYISNPIIVVLMMILAADRFSLLAAPALSIAVIRWSVVVTALGIAGILSVQLFSYAKGSTGLPH